MSNSMTSNKPYLMRATLEWVVDNQCSPYLIVNTLQAGVQVPEGFDQNGQITLNISANAVRDFVIDNEAVSFSTKFSGVVTEIYVPCVAVLGLVAKENGQGIFFEIEESESEQVDSSVQSEEVAAPVTKLKKSGKPTLKVVK